jgi:Protein of Unknown function (DUF2784)
VGLAAGDLAAPGWGLVTVVYHLNRPLTFLEDRARRRAGEPGLTAGFIDLWGSRIGLRWLTCVSAHARRRRG